MQSTLLLINRRCLWLIDGFVMRWGPPTIDSNKCKLLLLFLNSTSPSPSSATYMRRWTGLSAPSYYLNRCWLFISQFDCWEQISAKSEIYPYLSKLLRWYWENHIFAIAQLFQRNESTPKNMVKYITWSKQNKTKPCIILHRACCLCVHSVVCVYANSIFSDFFTDIIETGIGILALIRNYTA